MISSFLISAMSKCSTSYLAVACHRPRARVGYSNLQVNSQLPHLRHSSGGTALVCSSTDKITWLSGLMLIGLVRTSTHQRSFGIANVVIAFLSPGREHRTMGHYSRPRSSSRAHVDSKCNGRKHDPSSYGWYQLWNRPLNRECARPVQSTRIRRCRLGSLCSEIVRSATDHPAR